MSKRRRLQNHIFQRFEVTIDAISARGWGQGTYIDGDQKVPVEVRGAVVGDRVVVEGRRIDSCRLQHGDTIRIGMTVLRYEVI